MVATPKPRAYDPAQTRRALQAQFARLREVVGGLGEAELALPTRLGGWSVRELAVHTALTYRSVERVVREPAPHPPDLSLTEYAAAAARYSASGAVDEGVHRAAAELPLAELYAAPAPPEAAPDQPVDARIGLMSLGDYLVTRCVELAVHTDDLAAALGRELPQERECLGTAVQQLADTLAAVAPGGAVEVRVPPFAIVQCVAGPRHTPGTPPHVVEAAPVAFLRLATGRVAWGDVIGTPDLTASGEHADLSSLLPVLR